MTDLVYLNVGHHYEASPWGWNREQKRNEIASSDMQYLLIITTPIVASSSAIVSSLFMDPQSGNFENLAGFASYLQTTEPDHHTGLPIPVLYIYELQIKEPFRRLGIGKALMNRLLEEAKSHSEIRKIMLTCFISNEDASRFYRNKCDFQVDPSSPSNMENDMVVIPLGKKLFDQKAKNGEKKYNVKDSSNFYEILSLNIN